MLLFIQPDYLVVTNNTNIKFNYYNNVRYLVDLYLLSCYNTKDLIV